MDRKLPQKSKKGRRAAHHRATGKYARQFLRTEANLKRKGLTNKKVRGS